MSNPLHYKPVSENKSLPSGFHDKLSTILGHMIKITFEENTIEGKLLAFDRNHCNLCILGKGDKMLFIRGDSYRCFEEV